MSVPVTLANGVGNLPDASQLMSNFNYLESIALSGQNLLINSGFDWWQRGASFTISNTKTYTSDRWNMQGTGTVPTGTVSQETSIVDSGASSMKIVISGNGSNSSWFLQHIIENYQAYLGKTLSISFRVKASSVSGTFTVGFTDGVTNFGATVVNSGGFVTYTATGLVSASATGLSIFMGNVSSAVATGTFYVGSVMLVIGANPVPYIPRPYAQEWGLCQRYFQTNFAQGIAPANNATEHGTFNASAYTTGAIRVFQPLKATMRVSPTVTLYSTSLNNVNGHWGFYVGAWTDPTSNSIAEVIDNSFTVELVKAAAFTAYSSYIVAGYWTADAEL